jgi:hypothetical protein
MLSPDTVLAHLAARYLGLQPSAAPLCICRMSEADGLCSLRLRAPCQWEDLVYEAVAEVAPIPVLSGNA